MNISDMKEAMKEAMRELEKEAGKGLIPSLEKKLKESSPSLIDTSLAGSGTITEPEPFTVKEEVKEIPKELISELKADSEPPLTDTSMAGSGTVTETEPLAIKEEKKETIIVLDEKSFNLIDRLNVFENKLSMLTDRVRDIENRKSFIQKIIDYFSNK